MNGLDLVINRLFSADNRIIHEGEWGDREGNEREGIFIMRAKKGGERLRNERTLKWTLFSNSLREEKDRSHPRNHLTSRWKYTLIGIRESPSWQHHRHSIKNEYSLWIQKIGSMLIITEVLWIKYLHGWHFVSTKKKGGN